MNDAADEKQIASDPKVRLRTEGGNQWVANRSALHGVLGLAVLWLLRLVCAMAGLAGVVVLVLPHLWATDPASDSEVRALAGFVVLCCEVFAFHGGLALLAFAVLVAIVGVARGLWGRAGRRRGSGRRRSVWRDTGIVGGLALIGIANAGPGLVRSARAPSPELVRGQVSAPTFTVLSHNLLFSSAGLDRLATLVERERPDAIMLQEVVGERAHEILCRFADEYPYVVWPNTHRWGAMLLSTHPFIETPAPLPGQDKWRIDQPIGIIEFDGASVALMSVHLPAPNRLGQLVAGPQMTDRLAGWIEDRPGMRVILAGDFNAPLWTTRMAPLREAGIRSAHAAVGGGRGATWPARTPLRHAPGIRLDQAGFTGDLRCIESRVLEPTGSDHRPILARFVRASSAPSE